MKNIFECLLEITDRTELTLTLAILARSTSYSNTGQVSHNEILSLTGLPPSTTGKAVHRMLARGLVTRLPGMDGDCPLYQVLWDKVRIGPDFNHQPDSFPVQGRPFASEQLKLYFMETGFIDLLPQALTIATDLGYTEEEMVQAVCLVFDRQRTDPPVRNRTAWFRVVFKEKLGESRAQILAFKKRSRA